VQEAKVSPMVFQVYAAVAVGLTSLLVLTYNKFVWSWWGTLGAGLWMASQPFAFFAINLLGVSLGPAIWAGATIAVSFMWGTALFGEPVKSLALCIVAILILVAGICGVTASGTQLPHTMMASWASTMLSRSSTRMNLITLGMTMKKAPALARLTMTQSTSQAPRLVPLLLLLLLLPRGKKPLCVVVRCLPCGRSSWGCCARW